MRSRRSGRFTAALMLATVACGPGATTLEPPPRPAAKPATPPATRAHWSFAEPFAESGRSIELGGGKQLLLAGPRRAVKDKAGVREASSLLPLLPVAATTMGGRSFLWVDAQGNVAVTEAELSEVKSVHAPSEPLTHVAAAAGVVMGISSKDGSLLRTIDGGQSWVHASLDAPKLVHVVDLALDEHGHGLVLAMPQRLFQTNDAGASFMAVPGDGQLVHDVSSVAGMLIARGHTPRVVDTLALRALTPEEAARARFDAPPSVAKKTRSVVMLGDRVLRVSLEDPPKAWLGKVDGAAEPLEGSRFARCGSPRGGAFGDWVEIACTDADAGTVTLRNSRDGGKSFGEDVVQLSAGFEREDLGMVIGAGGAALLGRTCNDPTRACGSARWRTSGTAPWTSLGGGGRLLLAAVDSTGTRVLAVVGEDPSWRVVDAPFATLGAQWGKPTGKVEGKPLAIGIDAEGRAWMIATESDASRVLRASTNGNWSASTTLPFSAVRAGIAGARAIAYDSMGRAHESDDAGTTWVSVAAAPPGDVLACHRDGCAAGDWLRIGWDLPAIATEPRLVDAAPKPKPSPASGKAARAVLTCAASGKPSAAHGEQMNPSTNDKSIFWSANAYYSAGDPSEVSVGTAKGIANVSLLPPAPAKRRTYQSIVRTEAGPIAVRYALVAPTKDDGGLLPVEVWLGWLDRETSIVRSAHINEVPAFRVPFRRGGTAANLAYADDGIVFAPYATNLPMYFAHSNGKVDSIPRAGSDVQAAVHGPAGTLLAATNYLGTQFSFLPSGSTSWQESEFMLWNDSVTFRFDTVGPSGATYVVEGRDGAPGYRVTIPIAALPKEAPAPEPITFPAEGELPPACTAKDRTAPIGRWVGKASTPWRVDVTFADSGKSLHLPVESAFVRVTAEGHFCAASVAARDEDGANVAVSMADLTHAFASPAITDGSDKTLARVYAAECRRTP